MKKQCCTSNQSVILRFPENLWDATWVAIGLTGGKKIYHDYLTPMWTKKVDSKSYMIKQVILANA